MANHAEVRVANYEVLRRIERQASWITQGSEDSIPAVPGNLVHAISGNGGNVAVKRHLSDPIVPAVSNINTPISIDGHRNRAVQRRVDGGPAVTTESYYAVSGNHLSDAVGSNSQNEVIQRIRDVKIAGTIDPDARNTSA